MNKVITKRESIRFKEFKRKNNKTTDAPTKKN